MREPATGNVELRGELRWKNPGLVRAREEMGLNQTEAADAIGIANTTLNAFECLRRWPGEKTARKIADFYALPAGELFSPELRQLVEGDFEPKWKADVWVEADRLLPISECRGLLVEHTEDIESDLTLDRLIRRALTNVSKRERRILKLLHQDGWSSEEIGNELGISRARVDQLRNRAYEKIRQSPVGAELEETYRWSA